MMLDVDQRVLDAAVGPSADGEHAERRILAKHVEEAEGRGVDHAPGSNRRYPGDRPRQDESCQQLVAIARGEIVSSVFHTGIPYQKRVACRVGKATGSHECAPDDKLRVPTI